MTKLLITLSFIVLSFGLIYAQEPEILVDFDSSTIMFEEKEIPEVPGSIFDSQQRAFDAGVTGLAIDLSKNAALRMPIKLKEEYELSYGEDDSYSVEVWVKTIPGAPQVTPIAGNKKNKNKEEVGWLIYADEDGGWSVSISDGQNQYDYRPTVQRQCINDGLWHQLGITVNRSKGEVWFYFDGVNVAIYNTPGLTGLKSKWRTTLGGTASNWDYFGQWEAFNGYIDNFRMWDTHVDANEFSKSYQAVFPNSKQTALETKQLRVFSWNIWHGGHRFGKQVGVQRVIETIKATNADIVTLIETYGSGEIIADALGYHFYLISSNLSIMSRFPIKETINAFRPFNFGGVVLKLDDQKEVAVFDTWLHYLPDYKGNIIKGEMTAKQLEKDEESTRLKEIKQILKEIKPWIANAENVPVLMAGDFNTNSHLDWIEETKEAHLGYVVKWPVTIEMDKTGFVDSYREINPNPLTSPGYTGWPFTRRTGQRAVQSRIDYIFYKGSSLRALESKVVDYHPVMFPSDHAGMFTVFQIK
ncbi:hypothetical protein EYV94_09815 [Puteibacter caeruleilacunae]|nr:hypothetical protein EYV94_09815 [Puteibacter caeruleilacunae]